MKRLLVPAFTLLSLASLAQLPSITLADYELKGAVKSITTTLYNTTEKFGEFAKAEKLTRDVQEFDKKGNIVFLKETEFDDGDETTITSKVQYDASGRYSEANRYTDNNTFSGKAKVQYDEQGLISSLIIYDETGKKNQSGEYIYNSKKQVVNENYYGWNGQKLVYLTREFDENGRERKVTTSRVYGKQTQTRSEEFAYNNDGKVIRRTEVDLDGKRNVYTIDLDRSGNPVKKTSAKETVTYKYEYDSKDNWTRRETIRKYSDGDQSVAISERVIKYY